MLGPWTLDDAWRRTLTVLSTTSPIGPRNHNGRNGTLVIERTFRLRRLEVGSIRVRRVCYVSGPSPAMSMWSQGRGVNRRARHVVTHKDLLLLLCLCVVACVLLALLVLCSCLLWDIVTFARTAFPIAKKRVSLIFLPHVQFVRRACRSRCHFFLREACRNAAKYNLYLCVKTAPRTAIRFNGIAYQFDNSFLLLLSCIRHWEFALKLT